MNADWFASPLYADEPEARQARLLETLCEQMGQGAQVCEPFRRFLEGRQWLPLSEVRALEDLPFLPVSVFKRPEPLSFLDNGQVYRILNSSATTGQQPSRIAIDRHTAKLMTRGVTAILADFIGSYRRPYLVIDCAPDSGGAASARGAAVQGLMAFATEVCYALRPAQNREREKSGPDDLVLDIEQIRKFLQKYRDTDVVVYGFTYMLYLHLGGGLPSSAQALRNLSDEYGLPLLPKAHILHSGGWKRLQQLAIGKSMFGSRVAASLGTKAHAVLDYYGMVEQLGVVYPDCSQGNKHAPRFAEVIVRDPLTWAPCGAGQTGIIQVLSALSPSFPGQSLLTEDMALVVHEDGCACGRRGIAFRFAGRVPKAEVRGCSDVHQRRRT
ncbi:acyl-protein synthetase [Castellaniella ginsengisoli]|uniref:Acyl-protein synthetase n=1 Tax=Castellaniella ginsengisoli TaxID=546114 RepID=A0AB39CWS4_9BURK